MSLKVYLYEKCDTCRRAVNFLKKHQIDFAQVPIREQPPSKTELDRMLKVYGGEIRKLFNVSGGDYKKMNLKDRITTKTTSEALSLLGAHGNLVKRPFALQEDWGRVGFKEEEWAELLKSK